MRTCSSAVSDVAWSKLVERVIRRLRVRDLPVEVAYSFGCDQDMWRQFHAELGDDDPGRSLRRPPLRVRSRCASRVLARTVQASLHDLLGVFSPARGLGQLGPQEGE
jgi:hypothetical protein